ncbi:hypothetical protein ACFLR1_04030 [Bacteroidota bacterium]
MRTYFSLLLVFTSLCVSAQDLPNNVFAISSEQFYLIHDSLKHSKSEFQMSFSIIPAFVLVEGQFIHSEPVDCLELVRSFSRGIYPNYDIAYGHAFFGPGLASVPKRDVYFSVTYDSLYGDTYLSYISGDLFKNDSQINFRIETLKSEDDEWNPDTDLVLIEEKKRPTIIEDTIFHNSDFLTYLAYKDSVIICWGTSGFSRTLFTNESYPEFGTGLPRLAWHTNQFIGLEFGCGSGCWASYILPMNAKDSIQFIWYPEAFDQETNMLVHLDSEERDKLIVTQLTTGISQEVLLDRSCASEAVGACITNVRLANSELYFEYTDGVTPPVTRHLKY